MTYLAHVISKLYRPTATRQVFAVSRADAERLPVVPSTAVISITTPASGAAVLPEFEHLLRLSFEDVDHLSTELSARAKTKLERSFTAHHAQQILGFVAALPEEIRTIVVHCEGGFSRSCAVTSALHSIYGYTVEPNRLTLANQSIIAVLLDATKLNKAKRK